MNKLCFENRREKLRSLMHKAGLGLLVVSLDADRYYLSGFELHDAQLNESSGRLLICANGKDILCTDARFYDAAKRLWDEDRIFIYRGNGMAQINEYIKKHLAPLTGPIGFDANSLTLADYEALASGLDMLRTDAMVAGLRMIKEPEEILLIKKACRVNHQLMQWVPGVLVPGRSEAQIAWDIEQFFRNNGAEELAFPSIVAINGNAALPHAVPGNTILEEESCVLIDVGCRCNSYCSDQTRTFWVGSNPNAKFARDLELVQTAQEKAIAAIRPGALCSDIYAIAKNFLDSQGVGTRFTHGLGHGIGLQTHESPSLGSQQNIELKPGMIVTVEPGLYQPNSYGIRWEYMLLVTEDGNRIL